jgi:hypothetical protein
MLKSWLNILLKSHNNAAHFKWDYSTAISNFVSLQLLHYSLQIFPGKMKLFWLHVQGVAYIKCNLFNKMPQTIAPCTKTYIVLRWEVVMHEQRQLLLKVKWLQKLKYILFCWCGICHLSNDVTGNNSHKWQ